jgi:hypothetical protein
MRRSGRIGRRRDDVFVPVPPEKRVNWMLISSLKDASRVSSANTIALRRGVVKRRGCRSA